MHLKPPIRQITFIYVSIFMLLREMCSQMALLTQLYPHCAFEDKGFNQRTRRHLKAPEAPEAPEFIMLFAKGSKAPESDRKDPKGSERIRKDPKGPERIRKHPEINPKEASDCIKTEQIN